MPVFSTKDEAYQHALKTVAELQAAGYEVELVVEDGAPAAPNEPLSAQVAALTASGSYEPTASGALQLIEAADQLQKAAPPETPAEEWKQAAKAVADYLKTLPSSPGVYRMIDTSGDVIYVGKARSLKARVSNYIRLGGHTNRIARMIAATAFVAGVTPLRIELKTYSGMVDVPRPFRNVVIR